MRFFVVGSGRCGSTLLMRLLNLHPDLLVLNETHWIPKLYEFYGTGRGFIGDMIAIVDRTHHVNGQPTTPLTPEIRATLIAGDQEPTIPEFCDRLGACLMSGSTKSQLADKTPDYCSNLQMLQILWPETKFVHLIRDGARAALSMARHPGYRALVARNEMSWVPLSYNAENRWSDVPPADIGACLWLWGLRVSRARDEAGRLRSGSYREFRFEALCQDPRAVLSDMSDFLGLSLGEWIEEAAELVDPGRMRPAAAGMSPDFEAAPAATRLMRELGYDHSLPAGDGRD